MKSIEKYMLILVASLALLLAGCGGGGSTLATQPPPGPTPGQTAIMQAETALMNAETALEMLGASATDAQRESAYRAVEQAADNLVMALKANNGSPAAVETATTARQAAMNMADELSQKIADDAVAADAAMTAMATKLYSAIGTDPFANHGTDTAVSATGVLTVQNGESPTGGGGHQLKEDKTAMVAPLHGWTGSRHTATVTGFGAGAYTARMYADIEAPTPGEKINTLANFDTTNGVLPATGGHFAASNAAKIASPQFDHSAGVKPFELPTPNPVGERIVTIDGSYDGVGGVYSCNTGAAGTNSCSVTKASGDGYTLTGSGTWSFKPANPEDTLAPTPDTLYPVYGWWLHEASDGTAYVGAFFRFNDGGKGSLTETGPASEIQVLGSSQNLNGTATYRGGAAGMYAISAGATNDAGHFTADAELSVTFSTTGTNTNHRIEGTIDNFMGSDGMSRDWSVALKETSIEGNSNVFPATGHDSVTTWTMGGTAADDSGEWEGSVFSANDGGVPTVVTGVFRSEYENIGRMVGAFGANLEE